MKFKIPVSHSTKLKIPVSHFRHLTNLAIARNEDISETAVFLVNKGSFSDDNWLDRDPRYNKTDKSDTRQIKFKDKISFDSNKLMTAIQSLPVNVKGKSDGPIDEKVSFFQDNGVQGIIINGMSFLDPSKPGSRDKAMYELLKDKFTMPMTLEEYRIFNFSNSQYLRLVKEPWLFTMPTTGQIAVDAGAFVGYKALAMAECVGEKGQVIAFEIDRQNFELLEKNIKLNNLQDRVIPVFCALSDSKKEFDLYTQEQGTMGHSLTHFQGTGNPTAPSIADPSVRKVTTKLIGEEFESMGLDHVDCLHVSVNGHEGEVISGLNDFCNKIGVYRVVCVFKNDGVLVEDIVKDYFSKNNISLAGRSGGSLVAGPLSVNYHPSPQR